MLSELGRSDFPRAAAATGLVTSDVDCLKLYSATHMPDSFFHMQTNLKTVNFLTSARMA